MVIQYFKFIAAICLLLRLVYWLHAQSIMQTRLPSKPITLYRRILSIFLAYGVDIFILIQIGNMSILPIQTHSILIPSIGLLLVISGVIISIVARKELAENWTFGSQYHMKSGQQLITSGIYHKIRHPLYLGVILSYIGGEMVCNSYLFISFYAFIFVFYIQAKREEKLLSREYGRKYLQYLQQTAMFIPFIF